MGNNFGNSVILQWLQKSGWDNDVLKYGSFVIFETILLQDGFSWKSLNILVRPS